MTVYKARFDPRESFTTESAYTAQAALIGLGYRATVRRDAVTTDRPVEPNDVVTLFNRHYIFLEKAA